MIDQKIDTPGIEQSSLHKSPDAPVLEHFVPIVNEGVNIQRDRFGNRIFKSPSFSYYDRDGRETKAGLLISPEGEEFIKVNKGILNDIARGLKDLNSRFDPEEEEKRLLSEFLVANKDLSSEDELWVKRGERFDRFKSESRSQPLIEIDLGNNRKMEIPAGTNGRQSKIYVLKIGSEKYVIKVKKPVKKRDKDFSQPYINEMLQCQAIAADLKPQLNQAGIEMARFLFASGQMSCARFEEGEKPTDEELKPKVRTFVSALYGYIEKQHVDGVGLWRNIHQDISAYIETTKAGWEIFFINNDNFIKRSDGKLVCIDPVNYSNV